MNLTISRSLAAASLVLGLSVLVASPVQAQATTRAQVKMDRDTFLSMARWDEAAGGWVLREDVAMPEGVLSRAEVKDMRDKFLATNKWDERTSQWVPLSAPRDMSKLTRAQVKAETTAFLKMNRFDEATSKWVPKNR